MPDRTPAPAETDWFDAGLRFSCTQCGNCCSGPPGAVWFTPAEGIAMAGGLGMEEDEFYRRYARRERDRWSLRERHGDNGLDCILLDRESAPGLALCRAYDARPAQCRTWPFWPENLSSPEAWSDARHRTPCPGMDDGVLIPVEQIRILRDAGMA